MKSHSSLAGKNIWVAGGAGHLGSAITAALDAECRQVLCLDLADRAEKFVQERGLARTMPVGADLTDAAAISGLVDRLIAAHGVPDGVVYLVFASTSGKPLEEITPAEFQTTLDRSLPSTFAFSRAVAEKMKPGGAGSVVLFSSMYGVVAPDPRIYRPPLAPNPIDYGASKAALLQMTRYFAVHYGPAGIRFNCVTPGPFSNPGLQTSLPEFMQELSRKTALRRIGQSHEIVGPTLFLLSDGASYVTGHSLVVDGGWTVW